MAILNPNITDDGSDNYVDVNFKLDRITGHKLPRRLSDAVCNLFAVDYIYFYFFITQHVQHNTTKRSKDKM